MNNPSAPPRSVAGPGHSSVPQPPRPRLDPWPVAIIVFFVIAILGCITFVAFCSLHPTDLVAADYYEQEMRYQKHMERSQHAREASPLASIAYDPAHGKIRVTLPPGAAGSGVTGQIHLYRPSAAKMDRFVNIQLGPDGTQELDSTSLQPGLWRVQLTWSSGGQDYYLERQVTIPGVRPSSAAETSARVKTLSKPLS